MSSGTTVPLSPRKNHFPPAVWSRAGCSPLAVPFSSPPTQRLCNQPTYPRVEDSLRKKRTRTYPPPPRPLAQALPCPSTRARPIVVFLTAPLDFLLWELPCLSTGPRLTVVFLTFRVLAQGEGGTPGSTNRHTSSALMAPPPPHSCYSLRCAARLHRTRATDSVTLPDFASGEAVRKASRGRSTTSKSLCEQRRSEEGSLLKMPHTTGGAPGPDPPLRRPPPPDPAPLPPPPQTQPPFPPQTQPPPPPPRPESGPRVGGSRRMARCYGPPVPHTPHLIVCVMAILCSLAPPPPLPLRIWVSHLRWGGGPWSARRAWSAMSCTPTICTPSSGCSTHRISRTRTLPCPKIGRSTRQSRR